MTELFDHKLLHQRQARRKEHSDFLSTHIAKELSERLSIIDRSFQHAFQLNGSKRALADQVQSRGQANKISYIDQIALAREPVLASDFDILPEAIQHADLLLSPLSLHFTNDTPGLFAQIFRHLVPDGLFFAASLGADTLKELRDSLLTAESELYGSASARVIPFADIRDFGGLLQRAGFALPVIDSDMLTVRYDHMFALIKDIKMMGASNPLIDRSKKPVSRAFFQRAAEIYQERYSDPDGRVRASFNVIYLSGWKPHDSQQKPIKPGSAQQRLSDILKTPEIKLPK